MAARGKDRPEEPGGQAPTPAGPTPAHAELSRTAAALAGVLGGPPDLAGPEASARREDLLLVLGTKVVPELTTAAFPLFVGVQGGANVGKSTVFNALAAQLISPADVVASSTRHPLLYAHEDWRAALAAHSVFGGVECRELEDPRELIADEDRDDLLYVRFHRDDRLRELGLIDSPDSGSLYAANARGAGRIAAIADVTVFVVTAQKYKDRGLVDHLVRLLRRQAAVIVVFNFLDAEIVYDTLVEDLRAVLPDGLTPTSFVRVGTSSARYPEAEIEDGLAAAVLPSLGSLSRVEAKRRVLSTSLRFAAERAEEVLDGYDEELRIQSALRELARQGVVEAAREYAGRFRLAFPEETLALQKVLAPTEAGALLRRALRAEKASATLGVVGRGVRAVGDAVRRTLLRLTGRYEGSLDESFSGIEEYARARRESDADDVVRLAEAVRVRVEGLARKRSRTSRLAAELLERHLTPERALESGPRLRRRYLDEVASTPGTGERTLESVERWLAAHRRWTAVLGAGAIAAKVAGGLFLASSLPPDTSFVTGLFSLLKWLWFACGYLLTSYLVALAASLTIPGRRRFARRRRELVERVVTEELLEPLDEALIEALDAEQCERARKLARELARLAQGTGS